MPRSSAYFANDRAATMHMSSVIVFAPTSRTPRNMAGKPTELFTWLGKSDLPVPIILAPASLASHGQISGIGLAQMKHTEFLAITFTCSGVITPGPDLE